MTFPVLLTKLTVCTTWQKNGVIRFSCTRYLMKTPFCTKAKYLKAILIYSKRRSIYWKLREPVRL